MSISFSGLGSGMDYSSWIDQLVEIKMQAVTNLQTQKASLNTKQSTLNTVKATFNTFRSSLQSVADSKYGGVLDVFSSNTATSSDSKYVTASVTNNAARQDLSIFVQQLATNTIATGTKSAGKEIDEDTLFSALSNGSAKTGTFSIYYDNQKYEIEIDDTDTLGTIKDKLEAIDGISTDITDGKFTVSADKKISLGSNADTSNFSTILGLTAYSEENNSYTSSHTITELKDNMRLMDSASGFSDELTAGTFKIGSAEFKVDASTTLKSLINTINKSTEAGVKASFDYTNGKMILTSTSTGSLNINIEAGTSNITDILGFTENGKLADNSQITGQNAKVNINGTELSSFSNTLTSDVTGLTGVTLNLNAAMTEGTENTTVSIKQDTDKLYNQITQIIKDLNSVISQVDTNTDTDEDSMGALAYETQLTNLRNTLRTTAMQGQTLSDGSFASLSAIGISSGAVGLSVESDASQLVIDESKLRDALENDPQMVKELLVGSNANDNNGVITKMLNVVTSSLDSTYGYFTTTTNSINTEIKTLNDKIDRKTAQAETYRSRLERQFKAMDNAIAKLQEQYNGLDFSSSS